MPKTVNLQANTHVAQFLQTAIKLSDSRRGLEKRLLVQVALTVDGIEVPLAEAVELFSTVAAQQVLEDAQKLAVELVCDAGLKDAMNAMEEARRKVSKAVQEVRRRTDNPDEFVERVGPL